jgi:protein TonB
MPDPGEPPVDTAGTEPIDVADSIRWAVDAMPSYPGGDVALRAYLQENMVYPKLALEIGSEGKVRVAFVVWPDGHLTDVRVPESELHPELHPEALRLVKRMPNWVPAHMNGSVVAAHASVMIPFHIRD